MSEMVEREVFCKSCRKQLCVVKLRPGIVLEEIVEFICPCCLRKDTPPPTTLAKPLRKRDIYCAACGKYLCTLQLYREFSELGDILAVEKLKCRCKWKNGFTVTVNPSKDEAK